MNYKAITNKSVNARTSIFFSSLQISVRISMFRVDLRVNYRDGPVLLFASYFLLR